MFELNNIYHMDCLKGIKLIPDHSIDLIMTDPPYLMEDSRRIPHTPLAKNLQSLNSQIQDNKLGSGFNPFILDEMIRVMKHINCYIWCNKAQIPQYIDFFVKKYKCIFDIIIWAKTNPMPTFNRKYLSDKEICLYFRKSGLCDPKSYGAARTVYLQPTNVLDKHKYGHPTIKPLNIIKQLIENSTKEGDVVLDTFIGSGTTAAACIETGRQYIGFEINEAFYNIALKRLHEYDLTVSQI